jgi:6-phosphogluconolactonase
MIRVFPDLEALSRGAAAIFLREANRALTARGRVGVALSGGLTPRRTYELLAQPPFRDQVPWGQMHVFWGDERCVPMTDPRSNAGMAYRALLHQVPLPESQVHPITCEQEPREAARRYEELLPEYFAAGPPRLDLVFLGLGGNGHTASLFPRHAVLKEKERWVALVTGPGLDLHRVTLTPVLINQAAVVAFLVAGAAKAWILREVLAGHRDPRRWPTQLICPEDGELIWLLDREAAALLPGDLVHER